MISQPVTNFMLRGPAHMFLFSRTPNQTPMKSEVLTIQKNNTFTGLMLSLYVSIRKNNLSFFHKQRGVFVFARRILWWKITWGWIWLASTSSHQETLPVLVSDCESHFSSLFIDGGPMDANQVHALGETVQTWMLKYCSFRHTG